jgi:hypothetical protein
MSASGAAAAAAAVAQVHPQLLAPGERPSPEAVFLVGYQYLYPMLVSLAVVLFVLIVFLLVLWAKGEFSKPKRRVGGAARARN